MATCRSCKAEIIWAESADSRQRMPLDAVPVMDGTVYLDDDGKYKVLGGETLEKFRARFGLPLYRSHFSTCPNAAEHRRKK